MDTVEATFLDLHLFSSHYQRNNKRGSVKNLRCFPSCSTSHKQRGFCGRSVAVQVKTSHPEGLLCFCEFIKQDEPKLRDVGHFISLSEFEPLVRSKSEPLKPWVKGQLAKTLPGEAVFEFNQEKRGWHYGWASNKHTCNSKHVLVAYILEPTLDDSERFKIRGLVESPAFMLFCRRRRRFTIIPNAPISVPKSSSKTKASELAAASSARGKYGGDDGDYDDDDDEDEEDDEYGDEEEEDAPPPPPKQSKTKRTAPAASNKRTKLQTTVVPPPPLPPPLPPVPLDKNRVDVLLSLLHMAWRKLKDVPQSPQSHPQTASAPTAPSPNTDDEEVFLETDFFDILHFFVGNDGDGGGGGGNGGVTDFSLDSSYTSPPPLPIPSSSSSSSLTGVAAAAAATAATISTDEVEEWSNPDIEELARYLLDAADFKQSIAWLRGQGNSPDFSAFLGVLRDHIQLFMQHKQWTLADLDRIINYAAVAPSSIKVKSEFLDPHLHNDDVYEFDWTNELPSAGGDVAVTTTTTTTSSGSPRHFYDAFIKIPNITGKWSQTQQSRMEMERVRERTGSSWVMSKLFEFMESNFTIQQTGYELACRLWPMPALKFILDGEERPWGIQLPLFQPNWTYRAWTDGDVIHLQHQIENRRLTRKYWCDESRQNLYSESTLEVYDMQQRRFLEESRAVQVAQRSS
ncbi:hypothetical protein BASA81_003857 [Batrachochytrium salamandrivorans]|nr:hypothetical protein BASA81_003857 [Batrachochytrium salamandrivorans]